MSLKAVRQPTQLERIAALEKKDETTDERLTSMDKKLDEIYTLLIQAKGIVWLGTKIAGLMTLVCVVIGAVVATLKFLHG